MNAGHSLISDQMFYKRSEYSLRSSNRGKRLKISSNKVNLKVSNNLVSLVFDKEIGSLLSYNFSDNEILDNAKDKEIVLLSYGDPYIATTHLELKTRATNDKIETKTVHSSSIVSSLIGEASIAGT